MAVTYDQLMSLQRRDVRVDYTDRDTILYALSVGLGEFALDENVLPFVYEGRPMKTLPSMATVLMRAPVTESGLDFTRLLHGEQRLVMHAPIPASGTLLVDAGVSAIIDRGREKGAVVCLESRARTLDAAPVFTATTVLLARGDGGIGGPGGSLAPPHPVPDRRADRTLPIATRPDQALLYRLNEDRNPLHADPQVAARAGLDRPILYGLCTYGLVCQTLVRSVCGHDPARMLALDVRFSAPVYPGEALELDIWRDGETVSFRCRAPQRDLTVLDHGRCLVGPAR